MKEPIGLRDYNGKVILEGDILSDKVPSKGIVMLAEGLYFVTSDYQGRNIKELKIGDCDELNEDLIYDNRMVVIGNIHDNPNLV